MKKSRILTFAALAVFGASFIQCKDEEPLVPSEITFMTRFEFPEGDSETDRIFAGIYERFGVRVIYKNWTKKDWGKSWVNSLITGSSFKSEGFKFESGPEVDTLKLAAEFIRDDIFAQLNPEITSKIYPPYIYLVNSYCETIPFGNLGMIVTFSFSMDKPGMDFIICSPYSNVSRFLNPRKVSNPVNAILNPAPARKQSVKAGFIWKTYFKEGLSNAKKVFAYPDDFMPEVDFTRSVNTASPDDPDYYLTRGFIDVFNVWFTSTAPPNPDLNVPPSDYTSGGINLLFEHYLMAALYHSEQQINSLYGKYPKVIEGYNYVVGYIKEKYGIDLKAFTEKSAGKIIE